MTATPTSAAASAAAAAAVAAAPTALTATSEVVVQLVVGALELLRSIPRPMRSARVQAALAALEAETAAGGVLGVSGDVAVAATDDDDDDGESQGRAAPAARSASARAGAGSSDVRVGTTQHGIVSHTHPHPRTLAQQRSMVPLIARAESFDSSESSPHSIQTTPVMFHQPPAVLVPLATQLDGELLDDDDAATPVASSPPVRPADANGDADHEGGGELVDDTPSRMLVPTTATSSLKRRSAQYHKRRPQSTSPTPSEKQQQQQPATAATPPDASPGQDGPAAPRDSGVDVDDGVVPLDQEEVAFAAALTMRRAITARRTLARRSHTTTASPARDTGSAPALPRPHTLARRPRRNPAPSQSAAQALPEAEAEAEQAREPQAPAAAAAAAVPAAVPSVVPAAAAPEPDPTPRFVAVSSDVPLSRVLFSSHDVDDSGTISAHEFKGLVYSMGYFMSDAEAAVAIASLSRARDGQITYDDFLRWWQSDNRFKRLQLTVEQADAVQQATEYFQHFDRDEKGYVDEPEFAYMFSDMSRWGYFTQGTTIEQALAQLKGDRTGHVSFNDYIAWLLRIGSIRASQMS